MTAKRFLLTTFFLNLVFAAFVVAGCLFATAFPMACGVGSGGILGAVNFYVLGVIILRLLSSGTGKLVLSVLLVLKMTAFLAAAFVLIKFATIDIIGFAVGFSTTVVAVVVNSTIVAWQRREITF